MATADSDLMMPLIEHTGRRTGKSRFHKVKLHRGELFNTWADTLADRGSTNQTCIVQLTAKRRIIFTIQNYSWVWCNK
eukprot:21642-Rhodomonas_salina.1